jgi:hypothetical protein
MKINEILVESTQLDEGPFGDMAKKVGTGVGKAVGGVAKGVGAVAGGVAGIGQAVKKGFQAGKAVVGGDDEDNAPEEQPAAAGNAPAAAPNAQQINQAGPKGTAPAKPVTGVAKQAMQKMGQAMGGAKTPDQAGQTLYAQVKSQVNQLDKKGKQRILQLLQKSLAQPAAAAPAAAQTQTAGKTNTRPAVNESFSLYRVK